MPGGVSMPFKPLDTFVNIGKNLRGRHGHDVDAKAEQFVGALTEAQTYLMEVGTRLTRPAAGAEGLPPPEARCRASSSTVTTMTVREHMSVLLGTPLLSLAFARRLLPVSRNGLIAMCSDRYGDEATRNTMLAIREHKNDLLLKRRLASRRLFNLINDSVRT